MSIDNQYVFRSFPQEVFHEVVKEGRMTKKGHKIASWKMRQFVLTSSALNYYDDNLVLKVRRKRRRRRW